MFRMLIFVSIIFSINLYGEENGKDIKKFWRTKLSLARLYVKTICKEKVDLDMDNYLIGTKVNDAFLHCMEERLKDREMKDCKINKIKKEKIMNKFEESRRRDLLITLDINTEKGVKINEKKVYYENIDYYMLKKSLLCELSTNKGGDYYYEPICFKECLDKATNKVLVLLEEISSEKICNDYRVDITLMEGHDFSRVKVYTE